MPSRPPRHDRASAYARSGLFKALGSFADLESRIERLPTEQERGAAFEVFVEAYLSTDEMAQAEEVWVGGKVPAEVRRRLNLPARDYGYDGVFRTKLDELVPYQAKFRSGRTSLPYAELATFFGISEKADRRVVLTNSIALSEVAESRTAFQTTRGGDFDRLDAAQLAAIAAWVEGIPPPPQTREPRPHQKAALADIERELSGHDRATVVMACGTGKTLASLWAAEQAQPKRVLVLVPSLNLLRQTLHEWAKWTNWGARFRYLCVCSDPKVAKGIDDIEIRPEDADFPVRTDPAIVGRFLDQAGDAVSVVFCTYQSAPVVGEAMQGRQPFDLGIFDEAHKTTGREGTRYAFALKDKNLPIRKRLFLTATPRHYDIRKRDKEGDFAVASMDDVTIYGRVAHRLTFAQAAAQNIIVPYKVVISVVDSDMIDNALLDQSEVEIKGDPVRAKWVAHQIALKRAVEEHALKRVITFHSSIKAAAAFASDESEGVGMHLPEFERFHVSGVQPTAERDEHMREFARVQKGIITNARCLTEGVDVPSVDMVAFMNPRRSRVDIVQAVGRAMRTAGPDKTCGYVLVPLFLEMRKGETLSEALERSDFNEIAEVLNAMRENDGELNEIIQTLMVDRGRTGGFDESRLRDKVEVLGPQIQLSELAASIRARLVEELGSTWDIRYGQLFAYKQTRGHCNVPQRWKDNPSLSWWCANRRNDYKSKKLSLDQVKRLNQLGFVWEPKIAAWEEMYAALVAYKQAHGDCNVPQGWKDNPALDRWCRKQKARYKSGKLSQSRIGRLKQLAFVWTPHATRWEEMYAVLAAYKQLHGNCNVPDEWKENPKLGIWCRKQRAKYKSGGLAQDRVARLEQLRFLWDPYYAAWEEMYSALVAYTQIHGDCNVPQAWKENRKLGRWCNAQRQAFKRNTLSQDQVARLEQLGFVWEPKTVAWEEMYSAMVAYKKFHGDCNVRTHCRENPKLGDWCNFQRQEFRRDRLSQDKVTRLEKLGFVWEPRTAELEDMYAALAAYKRRHGNCDVPVKCKEDPKLGIWCATRRTARKRNKLSQDQISRLDQLGFIWEKETAYWEKMYAALAAYEKAHGNCNVPAKWKEYPALGNWCFTQRRNYKDNRLSPDHVDRLRQLGFVWDPITGAWEKMFAALAAYKKDHGDCNVPAEWRVYPALGTWCRRQRGKYQNGQLSSDHVKRLEGLGFRFVVGGSGKN